MTVAFFDSDDLAGHVSIIRRQAHRSMEDPVTGELARKIVQGRPDGFVEGLPVVQAWGLPYQLAAGKPEPARTELEEIQAVWNFLVLNVSYMFDPPGFDMFSTVRILLEAGTGDCDDAVVYFGALLGLLGFKVKARVISVGNVTWEHVYPLVALPRGAGRPTRWMSLDWTVRGALPGWEYEGARAVKDFPIVG